MGPMVTLLFSIDNLRTPTFWAEPCPVVQKGANVTLRCQGKQISETFQLWSDEGLRDTRQDVGHLAEFVLRDVDDERDARTYSCRYGQGSLWSELSEPVTLVVMTEVFPTPSLTFLSGYKGHPGRTVTFRCETSLHSSSQVYTFALLEAKSLELLQQQSPGGAQAQFPLQSVRPEDTGNYSCIYYQKTPPHRGSLPSPAKELPVIGQFPKPTISAQPGLVVTPGANLTLWCWRPKVPSLEEVTFILRKDGREKPLQNQTSAEPWTGFFLPSVKPEDTGSYSCAYRHRTDINSLSSFSDSLELVVPGSLPRPSLSVISGMVVKPGTHVILRCQQPPPPLATLWRVTFVLLKMGPPQPLQTQSPAGTSTDFLLLSVTAKDTGIYTCLYYGMTVPYQVSEPSEGLEIWVTDALPKPFLSAWPGTEVASGTNVTLLCQGPSRSTRFVLYKEGEEEILPTLETTQDGAQFFLADVTPKHSGSYSCSYQPGTGGSFRTEPSEPLELRVRGERRKPTGTPEDSGSRNTIFIVLSCVSFFLLILLVLCVFILSQRSIPMGSLQGNNSRRYFCCPRLPWGTSLPSETQSLRQDPLYTEMAKDRPGEPSVSMAEDSQGVSYAQLNIRKMNERKGYTSGTHNEPTLYATVS